MLINRSRHSRVNSFLGRIGQVGLKLGSGRVTAGTFLLAALIVFYPGIANAGPGPETSPIPIPNINGVSPASVAPGSAGFTLTVNGSNFVTGAVTSVVYWNSTALVTTYVGRNQLTAAVPAGLVANAASGWITVSNSGKLVSNLAYVNVTGSTSTLAFVQSDITIGGQNQPVALGDFNGDGKLDIVTGPYTGTTISVLLGNGDGTFQPAITSTSAGQSGITVGDFNNDGILDVAIVKELSGTVSILLGNGDGTFQAAHTYAIPVYAYQVAVGDFNGDGKLDVAVANEGGSTLVSVFLGNGDGTLQAPPMNITSGSDPYGIVVGDFNGDGKLDLAVSDFAGGKITILLGDGTGSFVAQPAITIGSNPLGLAVGDFNKDGKADLAVASETTGTVSILLGNGDGTFLPPTHYSTFGTAFSVAVGDLNGDGNLDLAISGSNAKATSILLGNGDGTFQPQLTFGIGSFGWTEAMGDLDGSGRLGLAIADFSSGKVHVLLQGVVITPSPLTFASQGDGSTSAAQTLTLTNATGSPVTVSGITFSGTNPLDFAETDNCVDVAVASAGTCTMQVTFTPSITGAETATLSVADNSHGSPQTVLLNGTGAAAPFATLAPSGLIFTTQPIGVQSIAQTVTLTNTGNAILSGIGISITGTNSADFAQTNACTATLATDIGCTISVTFTPSLVGSESASLSIADNAPGNPQTVPLSGTGAQITPTVTWATPAPITFGAALSGTQLNATTGVAGSFVYTPPLGTVLGAGSRLLSVTFTPTDAVTYTSASGSVMLTVNKAVPVVTWATPAAIIYGTPLGKAQLNARSNVEGNFVYTPAAGTVLGAGSQPLVATFTPILTSDYTNATGNVTLTVNKATPVVTWATPAAITYGTALSVMQLNATANIAGTFVYTPSSGVVLGAGNQPLSVAFTPTDTTDYNNATGSVSLTVNKATPVVTWATPATITYGTALGVAQLDATASVAGTFVYTPVSGTVLGAGSQLLSVAFTPADSADYNSATGNVTLAVGAATTTDVLITSSSSVNPGASVTFTATLSSRSGVPAGSVSFLDGDTTVATSPLSGGVATYTTTTLTVGTHAISAIYAATGNFLGSSSNSITETIITPTFTMTPVSGSGATPETIDSGQSAQFRMILAGIGGLTGPTTFSVTGLPQGATGTFNPTTFALSATPATELLTVATTARLPYVSHLVPARPPYLFAATMLSIAGFVFAGAGLPKSKRRNWPVRFALLGLLVLAGVLGGCTHSGNFQDTGTPAGTYQLVVTGTSGGLHQATTMTLIVK